jgi:hypothetical protein
MYMYTGQYVFVAWCLIKYRDIFTLPLHLFIVYSVTLSVAQTNGG